MVKDKDNDGPIHQTISEPVEVFQYIDGEEVAALDWLEDAGANTSRRRGFLQFEQGIEEGWIPVKPGEYIVKPADGKLYVLDDLEGEIEPVPAKPKTRAPRQTKARTTTKEK